MDEPRKAFSFATLSEKFGDAVAAQIRAIMLTSEFRTARNEVEKVELLNSSPYEIPIGVACKALCISTKKYYKYKNDPALQEENAIQQPRRLILSPEEELLIIEKIRKRQTKSKCMNGQEIRDKA